MPRIPTVTLDNAPAETAELLTAVKKKMGVVPNLVAALANSPAAAHAYLAFSDALAQGSLPARLRESIALAVGESNQCDYCVAAHTMLGKAAGLTQQQVRAARTASPEDPGERAALRLARAIVDQRGRVPDEAIEQARAAGYNDGQLAEIVANVALNLFTNYFNHVAQTEIDFPAAPALTAC